MRNVLTFVLFLLVCDVTSFDEVRPMHGANMSSVEGDSSTFYWSIKPWPPPSGLPQYDKFEYTKLTFLRRDDAGDVTLCVVEYCNSSKLETGKHCSQFDDRMLDFDERTPNGVQFTLTNTNFTIDSGEFGLRVEYGDPDIYSPITLDIYGSRVARNDISLNAMLSCRLQ